jgi:hypothetical protein
MTEWKQFQRKRSNGKKKELPMDIYRWFGNVYIPQKNYYVTPEK